MASSAPSAFTSAKASLCFKTQGEYRLKWKSADLGGGAMRIMLDTNLWSYLGDEISSRDFNREIIDRGLKVVVPPSTLVEVARLPKSDVRQRIFDAVGRGPWTRLRTEADYESMELVDEIRRLRPDWLRQSPDASKVASLRSWWTNKFWREALQDSMRMYNYETSRWSTSQRDYLVSHQREARRGLQESGLVTRPLTAITAVPALTGGQSVYEDAGLTWPFGAVEAWRLTGLTAYWYALTVVAGRALITNEDATLADWVGAYVHLDKLRNDLEGFVRLWAHDADLQRMRRNWLRWAVNFCQTGFKVTAGNPVDEQHATYLVDADIYLSADANFIKVLRIVHDDAPFIIAEPRVVSGDRSVPAIERILSAL
jgi:hypothetical protein